MSDLFTLAAHRSLDFGQQMAEQFADGMMNSLVVISRPGDSGYNETTREYTPPQATVVYDALDEDGEPTGAGGIAGITPADGPITFSVGDEPTYYESITAHIPFSCPIQPRIDDVVLVIANPDRDLVGRRFRITDVPAGGRINPDTTLTCVGIAPSRQWSP